MDYGQPTPDNGDEPSYGMKGVSQEKPMAKKMTRTWRHALAECVGEQYTLNTIRREPGRYVATDGRILAIVDCQTEGPVALLDPDAFARGVDQPAHIDEHAQFPQYAKAFPDKEARATATLDSDEMGKLASLAAALARSTKDKIADSGQNMKPLVGLSPRIETADLITGVQIAGHAFGKAQTWLDARLVMRATNVLAMFQGPVTVEFHKHVLLFRASEATVLLSTIQTDA